MNLNGNKERIHIQTQERYLVLGGESFSFGRDLLARLEFKSSL